MARKKKQRLKDLIDLELTHDDVKKFFPFTDEYDCSILKSLSEEDKILLLKDVSALRNKTYNSYKELNTERIKLETLERETNSKYHELSRLFHCLTEKILGEDK